MATVLIVDDEQPIVDLVRFTLEDERVHVLAVHGRERPLRPLGRTC